MCTAKNRTRYVRVCNNNVNELSEISLVFDYHKDDALYYELQAIRTRLKELIDVAADLEFGEEEE